MIQTSLPILELHSSDLTAGCLRAAQLKHQGKAIASYTTAMYRGALADEALCLLHSKGLNKKHVEGAVLQAILNVEQTAKRENRPLSESVQNEKHHIAVEVSKVVGFYAARFADFFAKCKVIGCQLPIRCPIEIDSEPFEFASHLDLLYRFQDGSLVFADWKWREETPTTAYLSRNIQFGAYAYSLANGEVMIDDEWVTFGEWPIGQWIHLPNLKPYARNGADYKAGEHRDWDKIIRNVPYNEACADFILPEIVTRVRMWRMGFFPTNPDPVGCQVCESNQFCEQMSIGDANENK